MTPRRSTRLQQKQRDRTPELTSLSAYKPRGPRAMAKLNKSKLNKSVPAITITSPVKDEKKEDPIQVNLLINFKVINLINFITIDK